ncbi:galactose-1-phosphate uridylyltransferase [Clostridiales bacterium]|nr:galactose-1-phosphate uridylyltransferase [Clostridiales bacterium]
MSELRQDILTGEWVIFAGNRMKRPYDFVKKSIPKTIDSSNCQFCPGNEHMTTSSIYQDGDDGEWKVRVFLNKYPALSDSVTAVDGETFYSTDMGFGVHEVVVDTPEHTQVIHNFSVDHIFRVLKVIRERFNTINRYDYIKYVQIFKNCGPEAGASIMHSHWQIIGVPVITREQTVVLESLKRHRTNMGNCLICDIVKHELEKNIRVVAESNNFVAFMPYASKMSYECTIAAKAHIKSFGDFDDEMLREFAEMLKMVLSGVKTLRNGICYNLCFEDTPKGCDGHWYMRVLPRMGNPAGFEYGTNSYINPIFPEDAAKYMREKIAENYRS